MDDGMRMCMPMLMWLRMMVCECICEVMMWMYTVGCWCVCGWLTDYVDDGM